MIASSKCPICGIDTPHQHSPLEQVQYRRIIEQTARITEQTEVIALKDADNRELQARIHSLYAQRKLFKKENAEQNARIAELEAQVAVAREALTKYKNIMYSHDYAAEALAALSSTSTVGKIKAQAFKEQI